MKSFKAGEVGECSKYTDGKIMYRMRKTLQNNVRPKQRFAKGSIFICQ